jgi:hypothetical protein
MEQDATRPVIINCVPRNAEAFEIEVGLFAVFFNHEQLNSL